MAIAEDLVPYVSTFESIERDRSRQGPPWMAARRRAALARFTEHGFPNANDEAWRFTNVTPIVRTAFRPAHGGPRPSAEERAQMDLPGCRVAFVNGRFAPELSTAAPPVGTRIESLRETLATRPDDLESLAVLLREDANVFAALNTAFFDDGALVEIAPGAVVADPIHLVFYSTNPDGVPSVSHPRALIVAGRGSQGTIVESYSGPDGRVYFTNAVTEIVLGDGAILEHYRVQREGQEAFHVASLGVRLERNSQFTDHSSALGAALSRLDIDVLFAAEGSECALSGLFMARGEQLTDTHTRIEHAATHCGSREVYKGILDGRSRGVFHGTILVRQGAQKTDAYQVNRNLLLSGEALVNSTPALQIYADDVKCKHGSTTGQLDAAAIFYLRSRGIGETAARSLLTYAFAAEVVQKIKLEPLRAALEAEIRRRLPGAVEGLGEVREMLGSDEGSR